MGTFSVIPLSTALVERIRRERVDDFGNRLADRVSVEGGEPCRYCLSRAKLGERLLLFSISPMSRPGPYKEVGPVFVHATDCQRYTNTGVFPPEFRRTAVVLRGYSPQDEIEDPQITAPAEIEQRIEELFGSPRIAYIHVRSLTSGCYFCALERAV